MRNLEWYLADLKSTGKNTIETVEKSLTDMFIRLVRIYPCLCSLRYVADVNTQQTRHIYAMFDQCWPTVYNVGPALVKYGVDVL